MKSKDLLLKKIARVIEKCRVCKKDKIGRAVPGEGNSDAKIVFIGEAPGRKEAESGRPFIGRSGQLLRSFIKGVGLKEKDIYITSPVKYLPKHGTPTAPDIAHGKIHLDKQLAVITPEIIVLLGTTAQKALLAKLYPVLKEHGRIIIENNGKYFITIHPAAVLRFPKYKSLFRFDFKKLQKLINEE